jgi:hypothetical protein
MSTDVLEERITIFRIENKPNKNPERSKWKLHAGFLVG